MSEERKTVLIVDDQEDARVFVETVVSEVGDLNILIACDGESALETVQSQVPDLVVLDVMMPGMDGFHVFYRLRQEEATAKVPVIMLTGVSAESGVKFGEGDMGDFLGDKPFAFLDKPVDPEKLEETVKKALGL